MNGALRKAAIFAHYDGIPRAEGRCAGDIILIVLRDGWFWMIPLAGGRTSVGLVMDGATWRASKMTPEALLEEAIQACPAAAARMKAATRVSEVWAASDWSYRCKGIAGDGYLLLGDAAAFIDPVFSTGVYLAMSSGAMAADRLTELIAHGAPLTRAAFADYERQVRRHVSSYLGIVSRFYKPSFMDIFMRPTRKMKIAAAVISLLAGMADPPWHVRWRIHFFYTVVALQRRFGSFAPPVPLLGVLERGPAPP
jgi:flavin-dependent dehydrogenase